MNKKEAIRLMLDGKIVEYNGFVFRYENSKFESRSKDNSDWTPVSINHYGNNWEEYIPLVGWSAALEHLKKGKQIRLIPQLRDSWGEKCTYELRSSQMYTIHGEKCVMTTDFFDAKYELLD